MKRLLVAFTCLLLFVYESVAQDFCGTPAITNVENVKILSSHQKRSASSNYILTVYFHVIRNSYGTGGVSTSNVASAYSRLNSDFSSHGIYFNWDGIIDYIDDDTYFYNHPDSCAYIFSENSHTDGIDIYLFPANVNYDLWGDARGVGINSAFLVAGNLSGIPACMTSTISHEMGHVLNLWHTHHGTCPEGSPTSPGYDANQCEELVNGSNSSTCGDYVEDTPADPNIFGKVNSNCVYTGTEKDANNQRYKPDVSLIMSYALNGCRTRFSTKQGERMRESIENLPYLINTRCYSLISGPSSICSSSTGTYTIGNLAPCFTVNWYFSNTLGPSTPTIQSSGYTCTITNNLSGSFMGTLNADIYYQGTYLSTSHKQIIVYGGLYGEYSSGNVTNQQFYPLTPIWVTKGNLIHLQSPNLVYKNVSYSVTTPSTWTYYNASGDLYLSYPNVSSNNPIYITIQNDPNHPCCDNSYQLVIMPNNVLPHLTLNIAINGDEQIVVSLVKGDCSDDVKSIFDEYADITKSALWTLEVYNATSSKKVFSKIISGDSYNVNTTGWASGVYIVKATYGNQLLNEKLIIK